ncbi:TonB-dependent siderophore receptor [Methylobacter sp.]|uniref:TonB-dependent siderophore receptor n=1 Tax=Methylobacter sp. TaxID=2051955 RepID=UPI00248A5873|nr:TonB-dependent siderophore receptor [Methylobacter sp.]MDI1279383.1 TonB-dependent siderophore receptor [Methylobacter sp.]MDI1359857.1 TonB-dependent siderophore receptor [Methylobacter sp.]
MSQLLFFLCALLSGRVYAVESTQLARQPLTLDTLIVTTPRISDYYSDTTDTATRTQSSSLTVPFSVGVVNQALVRDSMALRLEDMAMFVSGVQQSSADSGFNTDLRIRGFTTAGSAYLDGVQDNQHFQVRDMALVERVEILKGHSSVLYGSGSPGGTVNYISKKPMGQFEHSVNYETGSYDFNRAVVDSTGPLNKDKTVLYRVIAAGQLANDFRKNITHDQATFAPSLTWSYQPGSSLDVGFEYSNQNQPYRFDNVYTQNHVVYDQSYVDPRTRSDRKYWRFSAALKQELSDNWSLHFASHYFHVEREDLLFGFFTFETPTTLSGYYRDIHDHYDQYSLRTEIHGQLDIFGSQHHLVSGVERNASDDRLNSDRRIGGYTLDVYNPVFNYPIPATTRLDKDITSLEYGFYLNDQIDITRFWHVTGGMRYSLFNGDSFQNDVFVPVTDQDAVTYNAGLSFTPVDNVAGYFGYSQSFQPNSGTDRSLKYLPAKQGELYELGVKSIWFDKRLSLSSAVYQLTQRNLLGRDPLDPDYSIANGEIDGRGFELDVSGQILESVQIVANYSYMETEFTQHPVWQGNAFRSTPKHSGTLWGHYQLPIAGLPGQFKIGGGLVFVGRRFGDDANSFEVPGYVRLDLVAHYQLEQFDFRFKVENIMDKRYVSSSIYDDTVIQGNRRTALFLVAMKFD